MRGKLVKMSAVEGDIQKILPNHLNNLGTLYGGWVMFWADSVAAVVAERHSGKICATRLVDSISFDKPVYPDENLIFKAAINKAWNTSMEIGIKVFAENYKTGQTHRIASAYFTFVALDEDGKLTSVPSVIPETMEEQRRYKEAGQRTKGPEKFRSFSLDNFYYFARVKCYVH